MNSGPPVCRVCGEARLDPVLSLGRIPLANALLTAEQLDQPEPTYPLELAFCSNCALVEITETVPPEKLFREYRYFSSFSDTILRHAQEIARRLMKMRQLDSNSLVVEPASNDGYLLQYFVAKGIPVLGIEPAINVAQVAEKKGVRTLCEFFGEKLARKLRDNGRAADVIIANNVLAHVADLNGFVEGVRILLKGDGTGVIEVPYVRDMINRCEFDTIYHEHLCYFSLTSLDRLFRKHRLIITDVERIPVQGGSLRLFVAHEARAEQTDEVRRLAEEEVGWGIDRLNSYLDFGRKIEHIKVSLHRVLEGLKQEGKRVAAYGAAAKGTVLLNYCGIGKEILDFVVDRSPHKQGYYMPGVHVPIYEPSRLLEELPDYTLLLAWNLADEILGQETEYRRRGGKFILPVPQPKFV